MIVYDAENQVVGRIASVIAKQLLKGETIFVVNCEKAVLAGNPKTKEKFYLERVQRGDPLKGPFFPKYPDQIFRRAVRGMLPWDRAKGRDAYRRLKVFIGVPEELKNKEKIRIEEADVSKLKGRHSTLEKISLLIGAKKRW